MKSTPVPEQKSEGLTDAEKQEIDDLRTKAARKLKMARVLSTEELDEEAREALLGAVPLLGQALAVENHLPRPREVVDALGAPLAPFWGDALTPLREFIGHPEIPVIPTVKILEAAGST